VKRVAVYAGSFDPITIGHMYIIERAAELFDELLVTVANNHAKHCTFSFEERFRLVSECCSHLKNVAPQQIGNEYLVKYAAEMGEDVKWVVRGLRSAADFEYERTMLQINLDISPNIMTVPLICPVALAKISSSAVKGLVGIEGWEAVVASYVPAPVFKAFVEREKEAGHGSH
jgi:pantetheine-phosphate adenylyltransferase